MKVFSMADKSIIRENRLSKNDEMTEISVIRILDELKQFREVCFHDGNLRHTQLKG